MSDNLVDRNYFSQFMCMYIDVGTETVRRLFYCLIPKDYVREFFSRQKGIQLLEDLNSKKLLTSKENELLTYDLNPDKFDMSLLIKLLSALDDLPPPKNGWHSPLDRSDKSVAADLLRLRATRNRVLCHCAKVKLPKGVFELYWRETETILVRLIQQIHPEEETSLKERIDSYRHRETDIAKYDTLLNGWYEEINEIQEQIEVLCKNVAEFIAHLKENPVRYERYIKLLIEGGRLILSAFLQKELDKRGISLRDWLKENEELLKSVINDDSSLDELFLNTDNPARVDILLLAKVIRYGFKDLDSEDGEEIEKIQNAREKHAEIPLMDSNTFADSRENLRASLTSLSKGLRKEVRQKLGNLIQECKNRHEDNNSSELETYIDSLQQDGLKIKSLKDVSNETFFELKKSLTQMQPDGIDLKRNHCFEMKIQTACKNKEVAEKAEGDLFQVIQEAMENAAESKGKAAVRIEVKRLLELICGSDGVEISDVHRGCIIIRITCSTIEGILHIISLFENESFNFVFRNISSEMSIEFFETVSIHASLTLESLCEILVHKGDGSQKDQGIIMPITVTSAEGLCHIISLFDNWFFNENVSRIAENLSSHFGDEITLQISKDFEGKGYLTEKQLQTVARGTSPIPTYPSILDKDDGRQTKMAEDVHTADVKDIYRSSSSFLHERGYAAFVINIDQTSQKEEAEALKHDSAREDVNNLQTVFIDKLGFRWINSDSSDHLNLKVGKWNHEKTGRKISESTECCLCCHIQSLDHSKSDGFVLVFSSHGKELTETGVKFSNGEKITLTEIFDALSDEKCPSLEGKPRIILACSGHFKDLESSSYDSSQQSSTDIQEDPVKSESLEKGSAEDHLMQQVAINTIPNHYLLVNHVDSGQIAIRHKVGGSLLLHALKEIVQENYFSSDKMVKPVNFMEVLVDVSGLISRAKKSIKYKLPETENQSYEIQEKQKIWNQPCVNSEDRENQSKYEKKIKGKSWVKDEKQSGFTNEVVIHHRLVKPIIFYPEDIKRTLPQTTLLL